MAQTIKIKIKADKESACNRDVGSIPGSGSSPGEGNGSPLQYSCLENPRNRKSGRLQSIASQLDRTEQLTLSLFRECFSNLKSLDLVIGSSLLPSVPELFTSVFIRCITYSMLSLICCVPLFPNY